MVRFLRGLATAARERLAAAREELAEQRAADAERLKAERQARAADLAAQVTATPADETFAVALGAVFRETFLGELSAAAEQERSPAYLYLCAVPAEEIESVPKLLRQDFDVTDSGSAVAVLAHLASRLGRTEGPAGQDADAVQIARGCWLATAAAGAGLLRSDHVLELTVPFRARAVQNYSSWTEFGRCFLAGERETPGSTALGRRALAKTVDDLLGSPGSPWVDRPWPSGAAG